MIHGPINVRPTKYFWERGRAVWRPLSQRNKESLIPRFPVRLLLLHRNGISRPASRHTPYLHFPHSNLPFHSTCQLSKETTSCVQRSKIVSRTLNSKLCLCLNRLLYLAVVQSSVCVSVRSHKHFVFLNLLFVIRLNLIFIWRHLSKFPEPPHPPVSACTHVVGIRWVLSVLYTLS